MSFYRKILYLPNTGQVRAQNFTGFTLYRHLSFLKHTVAELRAMIH